MATAETATETDQATDSAESESAQDDHSSMLLEGQDVEALEARVEDDSDPEVPGETPVETPTEETPADDAPVETPEEPPAASFIDELGVDGFEDVANDHDGQARLLEAYRQQQQQITEARQQADQNRQLAEYGQRYLAELEQSRATSQTQATQQPAERKHWYNPPKFDAALTDQYREIQTDPTTGERTEAWKDGTPAEIRASFEAYRAHQERWTHDLINRPHEVLPTVVTHSFVDAIERGDPEVMAAMDKLFDERYGARQQQQTDEQYWNQMEQENAEWLFQKDPRTDQIARDADGYEVLSPEGIQFQHYLETARRDVGDDARKQWHYANLMRNGAQHQVQAAQQSASEQAQQTTQDKRAAHLRNGANNPASTRNRGGSMAPQEAPSTRSQNPHISPGQHLVADMQASGDL